MGKRKVASLFIDVSASTAKLTGGLNKAKAKVMRFQRATKKSFGNIQRAVFSAKGAVLGLAGAGGFGMLLASSMKSMDNLGKMTDRLNMTTLGFQALHQQAGLYGVSSEMVNSSVERMVKRLGEAASGTGAAKKELEKLNLSAKEMINLSADKQYELIAEAIGGLSTQSEKAAATAAIFGREGIKMLSMFEQGAEGIKLAKQEVKDFGLELSRVDVKQVENSNDAWFRVTQVIKGAANVMAVKLAPFLESIANKFLSSTKNAGGFGKITNNVMNAARTGIGYVLTAMDYMELGWETIKLGVLSFATIALSAIDKIVQPIRYVNELLGRDQPAALKLLTSMVGEFEQATISGQTKIVGLIANIGSNAEKVKGEMVAIQSAAESVAGVQVGGNKKNVSDVKETVDGLSATEIQQQIEADKTAIYVEGLVARLDAERIAAEEIKTINDGVAASFAAGMGNAVSSVIVEQANLADAMKSLLKSVVKQIIGSYVALAVKRAFFSTQATAASLIEAKALGISWATPAALASVATLGGASATGATALSLAVGQANAMAVAGARQSGGEVLKGKSYKVGEGGRPEIFTPAENGKIISNQDIQSGGNNINVTIFSNDADSFSQQNQRDSANIWNIILDKMNEEGKSFA